MTDTDYNEDLDHVIGLIGFLHPGQRSQVVDAIDEDRDGVMRLAAKIGASNVHAPAAAFMTAIKQGGHIQRQQGRPARIPARDALRRLYDAKFSQLTDYGWGSLEERKREAADYACSEVYRCDTGPLPPGGISKLENDLYASIGLDRA
jgi:hypothetical protein